MIGRQVIETTKAFTMEELYEFMCERWNVAEYNDFFIGKPTPASLSEYILLPATERFMVIVYTKPAKKASKKSKVILSVCETPAGAKDRIVASIPTKSLLFGSYKISKTMSVEKERKGPAEEVLLKYTQYMKSLLNE